MSNILAFDSYSISVNACVHWKIDEMVTCNYAILSSNKLKEKLIWLELQFNFVLIRWWNKSYIVVNMNYSTPCLTKHLVIPIRKEKYKPSFIKINFLENLYWEKK